MVGEEDFTEPERPLIATHSGQGSLWMIKRVHGGLVPLPLQGRYTSEQYAQKALDTYVQSGR